MRVYDLILKKRSGHALLPAEIDYLIRGYTRGSVPDYQISALLMAIYFKGMNSEETLALTKALIDSGETISLASIPGIKVDKHSTGGVGDSTTLILAPLVAACKAPVAKLSGRGLGHTGGTLDKLEAIPGFSTDLSVDELVAAVKKIGVAVAGQSAGLVPADKLLYSLRDVTATVDSRPLIAASVMSKKLAAGADAIVLDVKMGSGAFLKSKEEAFALARSMVETGQGARKKTVALVTSMDQPLGHAVGNALEVEEAVHILRGQGPEDLRELCLALGSQMLVLANQAASLEEARVLLAEAISTGKALKKFKALVENQHGDTRFVDDPSLLPRAGQQVVVKSAQPGFVAEINAETIGLAAMALGAGRENKDSTIDLAAGLVLEKKIGDQVLKKEPLAVLHTARGTRPEVLARAEEMVLAAYRICEDPVAKPRLIFGVVE